MSQGGPYGENLAAGYPNVTAAIEAWGNERDEFDFDNPGFKKSTGHFSQLVWKDTEEVGCGRVDCGERQKNDDEDDDQAVPGWFVVCEYSPPGNVQGGYEENVQEEIRSEASWRLEGRALVQVVSCVALAVALVS